MAAETEPDQAIGVRWFSRGVAGIGVSSFLADLGHEVPNTEYVGDITFLPIEGGKFC
jgi:hypothetical protein